MAKAPDDNEDENGRDTTRNIFLNFLYHKITRDIDEESREGSLNVGEMQGLREEVRHQQPPTDAERRQHDALGRCLATMGDEMNKKYKSDFAKMITSLNICNADIAYGAFRDIACRLFKKGITFGRIIALLYFGYEITLSLVNELCNVDSFRKIFKKLVQIVVDFFINEKISKWIEEHGGWIKMLPNDAEVFFKIFYYSTVVIATFGMLYNSSK